MASNGAGKVWLFIAITSFAIACGNNGGFNSGLSGKKALKDLSSKDLKKFCDAADDYISAALPPEQLAKAQCAQQALQTMDYAQCQVAYQACVDQLMGDGGTSDGAPITLPQGSMALQCFTTSELDTCKATVDDLEGCLQDTFALRSQLLHVASCQLLASDDPSQALAAVAAARGAFESPKSCETLDDKCPGVSSFDSRVVVPIMNPTDGGIMNPPPTGNVSCDDLDLTYDGTDCQNTGCTSTAQCNCNSALMTFSGCNPVRGCIESLDCDQACDASYSQVIACAQQNTCKSDSECGSGFCVLPTGNSSGTCSRGAPGDACVEDDDCKSSSCMTDPSFGTMRCKGEMTSGGTCMSDFDCTSGICVFDVRMSTMTCSDGENGDPCSDSTDCKSMACVFDSSTSSSRCSDRMAGSSCSTDTDCDSGRCASASGSNGSMCIEGKAGDPCDSSSDCTSGRCVTSQTTFTSTCAYEPGETCPDGVADCNGECRMQQSSCSDADCSAVCGGGSCSSATLATWSETDKSASISLANGDLTAIGSSSEIAVRATVGKTSGRWYWEVTAQSASSSLTSIGVLTMSASLDFGIGNGVATGAGYSSSGSLSSSAGNSASSCTYTSGSVIGVALDLSARVIYFSVDGVWQAGGDPTSGAGGLPLGAGNESVFPAVSLGSGDILAVNFGQSAFAHAAPDGFEAVAE
jgi:hypothetical protein